MTMQGMDPMLARIMGPMMQPAGSPMQQIIERVLAMQSPPPGLPQRTVGPAPTAMPLQTAQGPGQESIDFGKNMPPWWQMWHQAWLERNRNNRFLPRGPGGQVSMFGGGQGDMQGGMLG